MTALLASLRRKYHEDVGQQIVRFSSSSGVAYPNFADGCSRSSVDISVRLCEKLGFSAITERMDGQKAGRLFEEITCKFIKKAFESLAHLRPGPWDYLLEQTELYRFVQYRHLSQVETLLKSYKELACALGLDYIVKPDIVVIRKPLTDEQINVNPDCPLLEAADCDVAGLTPLRASNHSASSPAPFLHASISCKWTIRSDRSQNTRTEALNLIRNRKGPLPHIVAVTAEPLPTRIASLALGTGEMDCVYHFALHELRETCTELSLDDQKDILEMIEGDRLRDISDLPLLIFAKGSDRLI